MFKNVASQSVALFAFDTTTGAPKTGDAANMIYYVTKDWGTVNAITSNSGVPTEVDNTNAKGWYKIALSQTETNADALLITGKSSTSNISVVGSLIFTTPPNFSAFSLDSSGRVDAIKINSVSASSVTAINANLGQTQPVNFTGTGASALIKTDMVDVAGAAVSTSSAQIGVNVVNAGGTAWASGSLTSGVFATDAITATAIAADAIGASELAADAVAEIADAVWDEDATGHQTQGTFGQVLGDSGADTDSVWSLANTNLDATVSSRLASASYTAPPSAATNAAAVWDLDATAHQTQGTFGQAIGDPGADTDTIFGLVNTNLDAAVSSRLASGSYTAPDNSSITAIKAKTDNLPTDPADESLIIAATDAIVALIGTPAATVSGDIAAVKAVDDAIKAKTDNLPASPAATSDIPSADITAIKAKTDSLTYTVAGQVDANIQSVNDVTVTGTGASGNEWGP